MSARSREFRINLNHEDLRRCEAAEVAPGAFVSTAVREALAALPDPSADEEESSEDEVADQDTVSSVGQDEAAPDEEAPSEGDDDE